MAREMKKRISHFGLENSDAIEENERILQAGIQQRKDNRANKDDRVEEAFSPAADIPSVSAPDRSIAKKTNGIAVDVPIEDYMHLMQMKVVNRRTLKDLALQAIHEFVERNKTR